MYKIVFAYFFFSQALCTTVNADVPGLSILLDSQNQSATVGDCPLISFSDKSLPETGGREANFNSSCFVEVETIDINDYQIVDVRNESDFQQGHIANSINIPLHQIANKRFLKKKNILLVNNGLPQFEMGQFCQILKDKGFERVSIMRGGVHNWLGQDLPLAGIGYQKQLFDVIKIEDFMMDYDNKLIQIVNITSDNEPSQRIVPDAKLITLDKLSYEGQLRALIADKEETQKQIVVVLTEHDFFYSKSLLKGKILKDIYYLLGDKALLNKFKQTRVTINQARVNGPRAQQCGS